jgi:molybdate transport repressor ModE-like protein
MKPGIELKHLRLLQEISNHGTISGAARALGYSQPAVSQQVTALECRLRAPVIIRGPGGITLTEVGEILRRNGESILAAVSLTEAEVMAVTGLRAGQVRVACFPSGAASLLSGAMAHLIAQHPNIRITLTELRPIDALNALESGNCDVAVVFDYEEEPLLIDDRSLVTVPLMQDELQIVLAHSHRHADREVISLDKLRDERWIAGCPRCRVHLLATCRRAGFVPDIAFETDDYLALLNLTARGLGVALLPELILSVVQLPMLHFKPVDPPTRRRIKAVVTSDLVRMPPVKSMLEALVQTAMDMRVGA